MPHLWIFLDYSLTLNLLCQTSHSTGLSLFNFITAFVTSYWASPSGSVVKNLPAMQETQETQVQSLGQENSLEEGMATHSSILVGKISWIEEPGGLWSMGLQSRTRPKCLSTHTHHLLLELIFLEPGYRLNICVPPQIHGLKPQPSV